MAFDCELEPVVKFSFWHGVPGGPDSSGAGKADIFHDITFLIIAFNDFPKTYKLERSSLEDYSNENQVKKSQLLK